MLPELINFSLNYLQRVSVPLIFLDIGLYHSQIYHILPSTIQCFCPTFLAQPSGDDISPALQTVPVHSGHTHIPTCYNVSVLWPNVPHLCPSCCEISQWALYHLWKYWHGPMARAGGWLFSCPIMPHQRPFLPSHCSFMVKHSLTNCHPPPLHHQHHPDLGETCKGGNNMSYTWKKWKGGDKTLGQAAWSMYRAVIWRQSISWQSILAFLQEMTPLTHKPGLRSIGKTLAIGSLKTNVF